MENNNQLQSSFWQFSDQLRLHSSNLANLSLNNDSIWSVDSSYAAAKKPETRRNFDVRVGGDYSSNPKSNHQDNLVNTNALNDDVWKVGSGSGSVYGSGYGSGQSNLGMNLNLNLNLNLNGGFNKGIYSNNSGNHQYYENFNFGTKGHKNVCLKGEVEFVNGGKREKKNKEVKKEYNNNNNSNKESSNGENKSGGDKRFKTLPPSESLPKHETVGGYIFVCNNDTMEENLKRQLFGLPPRYRDSVRQITPGLPLFLYNYSTHQLHGIYEAASFGGANIDPTAWEDKKNPGESRFPAQVKVQTRKLCEPLDEDAFRPILHHYDGPKFRLELSVPEALSLLDIFAEDNS